MIIILSHGCTDNERYSLIDYIEKHDLQVTVIDKPPSYMLYITGDINNIDHDKLALMPGVEKIVRISEPYSKANRKLHPANSIVKFGNC